MPFIYNIIITIISNITNKIKGIKNFYLATCWQKICGGLPVGLKQGIDIVNHIKHGI